MISSVYKFQSLLKLIDDDCIKSDKSRLYYRISLNDSHSNGVVARSVRRKNNTPAVSFLIRNIHGSDGYTMLYLSQMDVIEVLSLLDEPLRLHLWGFLSEVYYRKVDTSNQDVVFERGPINDESNNVVFKLNGSAIVIPIPDGECGIKTSFGFELKYRDFCDCLSLMLSMEPEGKLNTILSKYYVLSESIAGRELAVLPPEQFTAAASSSDLTRVYDSISDKIEELEAYDALTFGNGIYDSCFQKSE